MPKPSSFFTPPLCAAAETPDDDTVLALVPPAPNAVVELDVAVSAAATSLLVGPVALIAVGSVTAEVMLPNW